MSGEPSRIRFAAVSLACLPVMLVAAGVTGVVISAIAAGSLDAAGAEVTRETIRTWARQHLLVAAALNSLLLIPGILLLARLGAGMTWADIGLGQERAGRAYAIGAVLGMTVLLCPAGLGYLLGGFTAASGTGTLPAAVVQGVPAIGGILLVLPALIVAAFTEELVLRGFLLRFWLPRLGKWTALTLTSAMFALLHTGNPDASLLGALGAFIAGMWLGLAFLHSGSLLFAAGLHLGWNAASAVVLGLPVSGLALPSLLRWLPSVEGGLGGQTVWGGAYGPEEGIAFHLALALAAVACARIGRLLRIPEGELSERSARTPQLD
jgi:membrane protease YdiL (CAAX protease family)